MHSAAANNPRPSRQRREGAVGVSLSGLGVRHWKPVTRHRTRTFPGPSAPALSPVTCRSYSHHPLRGQAQSALGRSYPPPREPRRTIPAPNYHYRYSIASFSGEKLTSLHPRRRRSDWKTPGNGGIRGKNASARLGRRGAAGGLGTER